MFLWIQSRLADVREAKDGRREDQLAAGRERRRPAQPRRRVRHLLPGDEHGKSDKVPTLFSQCKSIFQSAAFFTV
jgi:hypothetical protein